MLDSNLGSISIKEFVSLFSTKKDAATAAMLIHAYTEGKVKLDGGSYKDLADQITSYDDRDMADKVLNYFNEVTGKQYRNPEKIRSVIRQMPKVTFEQFQSVILHKVEEWGKDPVMEKYLRPATLFGSKNKFLNYLDDATNYWIQKRKQHV